MAEAAIPDALTSQVQEARRRSALVRQRSHDDRLRSVRLHLRLRQLRRSVVGRIYAMEASQTDDRVDRAGTVLVADDDRELRETLKAILELSGHRVLMAADGAEALQVLSDHEVDVLILDMDMPVHDGLSVLRQLDGARPVVIVNTGDDLSSGEFLDFFGVRAFGILRKPTPPPYLLSAVESAVAHLRASADERDRVADERDRVADERDRVAGERDRVAGERDRVVGERDRVADERDVVAGARDVIAGERDRVADMRDVVAEERDWAADRRDTAAEERGWAADRRDTDADERDRVADRRDTAADERDRVADERDRVADERDRVADERDRMADELEGESGRDGLIARARAAIDRSATLAQQTESLLAERRERGDAPPP